MDSRSAGVDVRNGATVVLFDGQILGKVHTVQEHYLLVEMATDDEPIDYEVPMHAVIGIEGDRIQLRVNREALTTIPAERQTAAHRLDEE